MKKFFSIFVSLIIFGWAFFLATPVHASMEGDTFIKSVQGQLAGECDNYQDNGGKRYCGCTIAVEGKNYLLKMCKTGFPRLGNEQHVINGSVNIPDGKCELYKGDPLATLNGCKIVSVRSPEACECKFTPNDYQGEKPISIAVAFGESSPSILSDIPLTKHQEQQLTEYSSSFDFQNKVCPKVSSDKARFFGIGNDGSSWDCTKPLYKDTTRCCCALIEKGSATSKYSCQKKTGFTVACGADEKVYPVPDDGSCEKYTTTGQVTADKQNPGIGKDKLLSEAATLNQLSQFRSPAAFIGQVIKVMLSLLGSIALGLYVWSGVLWTTAAGNSERVEASKKIIIWTTAGVAAILSSYVLVQFIFKTLR